MPLHLCCYKLPVTHLNKSKLFRKYYQVTIFQESIRTVPNFEVKLQLRTGAKPVFI